MAVLTFRPADPAEYGRVLLDRQRGVAGIVEYRDADAKTRGVGLCNAGMMAVSGARLWPLLEQVGNANAKGEFYLTDIVALARKYSMACSGETSSGTVSAPPCCSPPKSWK